MKSKSDKHTVTQNFRMSECPQGNIIKFKMYEMGTNEAYPNLSPPQRLLFLKKPRKRGKGGKKGKAEKRERRKKRERQKSEESLCQISVEIWQKLPISDRTQPECRLSFS